MNRGHIVLVELDPAVGKEQKGTRPAVVLGDVAAAKHQRFPVLVIAPLTSTPLTGTLYPAVEPTPHSRLRNRSYVLLDQLRAIDKARVVKSYGAVSKAEEAAIDDGLRFLFGLDE